MAMPIFTECQKNERSCVRSHFTTNLDSVNGYPKLEWNMPAEAKIECTPFTSYRMCVSKFIRRIDSNEISNQYACQRNDHTGNWQIDVESKLCKCTKCTRKIWLNKFAKIEKKGNEKLKHKIIQILKRRCHSWWNYRSFGGEREGISHTWNMMSMPFNARLCWLNANLDLFELPEYANMKQSAFQLHEYGQKLHFFLLSHSARLWIAI